MIVADANVVAYLVIEGDRTPLAQAVWDLDPDWRLPSLWRHELLNTLATYAKAGGVDLEDAERIWYVAWNQLSASEHEVDMSRALELAVLNRVSAYDAQYVALARYLDVPLITEDRRLRQSSRTGACPCRISASRPAKQQRSFPHELRDDLVPPDPRHLRPAGLSQLPGELPISV